MPSPENTSHDPFSEIVGRSAIEAAVRGLEPNRIDTYFVEIAGREYPVKQVARAYTGVQEFHSKKARRFLRRNGFEIQPA